MPDDDEHDPYAETASPEEQQPDPELLGSFDAFRARRAQERAEAEAFPEQFEQPYAQLSQPGYEPEALNAPDGGTYVAAFPPLQVGEQVRPSGRRRWRSVAVLGGVAVLAVGLSAGVYAAVQPSGGSPTAASAPPATASASPSPGSKAAKDGKAMTARLTVTAVSADSFTATTARGESVVVHLTPQTRFGTAARPFTRAQLVPGADIFARLRREADGTIAATVIAATVASGTPTATAA